MDILHGPMGLGYKPPPNQLIYLVYIYIYLLKLVYNSFTIFLVLLILNLLSISQKMFKQFNCMHKLLVHICRIVHDSIAYILAYIHIYNTAGGVFNLMYMCITKYHKNFRRSNEEMLIREIL